MRTHQKGVDAFIPLCEGPFKAFQAGTKRHELRPYCKRWSEKHFPEGRNVTLSWGYGTKNRLYGSVRSYQRIPAKELRWVYREAVMRHYGTTDMEIAMIGIDLEMSVKGTGEKP